MEPKMADINRVSVLKKDKCMLYRLKDPKSFLVNKTNRCTEFQLYWYFDSTCFGKPFCPSPGVLSRTTAVVHFMQLWPFATRSRMVANGHNCMKCTTAVVRLRTPDDGQKGCPKHVESKYQQNWNSVHLLVLFTRNLLRCMVIRS